MSSSPLNVNPRKYIPTMNKLRFSHLLGLSALSLFLMASCEKNEVLTGSVDTSSYTTTPGASATHLTDLTGATGEGSFTLREDQSNQLQLFLEHTIAPAKELRYRVSVDASALETYNTRHQTSYTLLPEGAVTLPNEGILTLPAGKLHSQSFSIPVETSQLPAATATTAVYLLPLKVEALDGATAPAEDHFFFLIKDERVSGSAAKESGVKIISIPEVNDTNPLTTLSFTLKKSGKPLIDAVVLFSSNINYDESTGRVYVSHNENVTAILANKDKYLKPLKDRGIKVILSILGNHDRSGVANLSDESARLFAQEIKNTCDAYDLDGVFLDDEYSNYSAAYGKPGFVRASTAAMSRLYYEIKKAQPHRWNIVYAYGMSSSLYTVEGKRPGEYIDYAVHDYGGSWDLSQNFPGLSRERQGLYSQEFNLGRFAYDQQLQSMKNSGYKTHMIFAMDPNRPNFSAQLEAMKRIARVFFDDELVYDGMKYKKDWK